MLNNVQALRNLESLSRVKQREVFCPIANIRAITTPLVASDDLLLRSTVTAIDTYDQQLSGIIHKHCLFPTVDGQTIPFEEFIKLMSHIDRKVLLWGIYAASYGTLGDKHATCVHCNHEFTVEVLADDVIHEDTLTNWEKDVPYNQFRFPVEKIVNIENIYKIVFETSLPTTAEYFDILSVIPAVKLRHNFEKFGSIFASPEELASITRRIQVFKTEDDLTPDTWDKTDQIHLVISTYFLLSMVEEVLDSYRKEFSKYLPVFKKIMTCPKCRKTFDFIVDIELNLFRRFLQRD